jgi:hypothetical protein
MSDQMLKLMIAGALLVHGLGHGGALGALIWIGLRPGTDTDGWRAARSWLFSSASASTATTVASVFWILSLLGFATAALSFWGVLMPGEAWRPLAIASAMVSIVGIALFFGTWPMFNTLAAMAMNIAVLVALLWLRWPSHDMFRQ